MDGALGVLPDDPIIYFAPSVPPYTNAVLTANLVFRVVLGILANLVCLVPLRLLYRNRELAAVVFIVNIELKNLQTVAWALIWRNDDLESWWPGYGLCDVGSFFHNFAISLYAMCLLGIMRNLAHQVGLMQVNPLTVKEKRRRNLVQVLIIFPLPILQLILTWLLAGQRYAVGTLVGCSWVGHPSWPYLVFFILIPALVTLMTVGYAVLIYFRFRQVAKATETAFSSSRVASSRAQRARRQLYLMTVSILVPFFPIVVALAVLNIKDLGPIETYDYNAIHNRVYPYTWDSIIFMPSTTVPFSLMNLGYIPILSAIPVFIFFGTSKDALNDYRKALVFTGLGRVFPRLYREYDPDSPVGSQASSGSIHCGNVTESTTNRKFGVLTSSRSLGTLNSQSSGGAAYKTPHTQSLNFLTAPNMETGDAAPALQWPQQAHQVSSYDTTIHRNPFSFRTTLKLPTIPFKLPSLLKSPSPTSPPSSSPQGRSRGGKQTQTADPCEPLPPEQSFWTTGPAGINTKVWSDEEIRILHSSKSAANDDRPVSAEATVHVETLLTRQTHDQHQR